MTEPRESASSSPPDDFPEFEPDTDFDAPTDKAGQQVSLMLDMARLWVREHQKASMLGAFAVGVFAGSWLRD